MAGISRKLILEATPDVALLDSFHCNIFPTDLKLKLMELREEYIFLLQTLITSLPDIIRTGADRFLHGSQTENLQQMVLHHISDNPVLVKVSSTSKCSERFFECNLDARYAISIPGRPKDHVPKPETEEVLHHFLAQVVVNPVQLLLLEQLLKVITQVSRAGRVTAKRFFNNDASPTSARHAASLDNY